MHLRDNYYRRIFYGFLFLASLVQMHVVMKWWYKKEESNDGLNLFSSRIFITVVWNHLYSICFYFCLASRGEKQTKKSKVYNFADQIFMPHNLFTGRMAILPSARLFRRLDDYFAGWLLVFRCMMVFLARLIGPTILTLMELSRKQFTMLGKLKNSMDIQANKRVVHI